MFTEVDYKILELVLQSPEPVPSRQLALVCDVSINTIRTEIDLLNQELAAHGVCIRMKRSSGTSLEVLNEALARPWMHQMRDMLIRNKRLQRKYSERVYSLTRTILCAPDGITVERLVQVFYVSRGTILADIKNVRALLERFHLSLTNRRGGHGFVVQGSEWHIRQCLLLLHKNYTITADSGKLDLLMQEQAFRAMFFMHSPHSGETAQSGQLFAYHSGARYDELSALLQQELLAQDEFTLPNIHYPKIINMLLLCISRKKYAAEAAFSGEQQTVLQASAEYKFICRLHCRLPEHFRQAVQENEMLMLTALLLCFEDENFCLQRSAAGTFCVQKAQEFAQYLQRYFDIRSSLFDETFYRGIASIFYRLQNQRQFSVINDREATSGVSRLGIGTGNLCLGFARFFEENFGFALEQNDALESFYILNSIISRMPRHYYCPRVLVVSEFGVSCAQSVAARLQMYYADQLGTVKSSSFKNLLRMDLAGWDLLLTDMSHKKTRRYLKDLPIPVLTIEFTLKYASCPELDIWLETHRQDMETAVLNDHCFYRTRLPDKEAVFRWLVQHFAGEPELQGLSLEEELHRNDRLMNQQRKNSLVFLPVLLAENCKPRIAVLINDHPFLWNDQPAQIFIFYEHPRSRTQERILSVILHKLLYMSPQTRTDLLESQLENPSLVLYPNE